MRHNPRSTACSTCHCRAGEIARAGGCPRLRQDFVDTQPVEQALASAPPRIPSHRAPVMITIRRSNPVATAGVVAIVGAALLSYVLLTA